MDPSLGNTVSGHLRQSYPEIDFSVEQIDEVATEDFFLHVTYSKNLENILENGLRPGKRPASECVVIDKLGEEDGTSHPLVITARKTEAYLDRLYSEVLGEGGLYPTRKESVKLWFDASMVQKMIQPISESLPVQSPKLDGGSRAPYVTLLLEVDALTDRKLLLADYDQVFSLHKNINIRYHDQGEISDAELIHPAYRYWRESSISNDPKLSRRDKGRYHIPELLTPGVIPPDAITHVVVPPQDT